MEQYFILEQYFISNRAHNIVVFELKHYFKINWAHRNFCLHSNVGTHGKVTSQNTILIRLKISALKVKQTVRIQTVQTPENIATIKLAVENSICHSALKHDIVLGISHWAVWQTCVADPCFFEDAKYAIIINSDHYEEM